MKFKKSDLLFLAMLDVDIEIIAAMQLDEKNKRYWYLEIKAANNGFIQEGIYHGARGEIRKFYQLNALFDTCTEIFKTKCENLIVKL